MAGSQNSRVFERSPNTGFENRGWETKVENGGKWLSIVLIGCPKF